ncbi:MAG: zinc ribbon domain-containing protein [Promethearchaeota archaeon]|nr:MAG: zinc ribbon domain-containing protein [Candidatus Lokiarchaeota archaeon]
MSAAQNFICEKCGERVAVVKALVKGYVLIVSAKCPNRHSSKFFLQLNNKDAWLDDLRISLYQCVCGEECRLEQSLPRGHYVLLMLNCPTHGTRKHFIATPVWNDLESLAIPPPPGYGQEMPSKDYGPDVVVPPVAPSSSGTNDWDTDVTSKEEFNKNQSGIKYCPSCGEEIVPGSFFCTNCGAEIK